MPSVLTEKILEKKLKDIIKDKKDKDSVLKAIKLFREIKKEQMAGMESQREKTTRRIVDDKKLQEMIEWSPYFPKRHQKQIEALNCRTDDIIICAGKRGGKTALCAYESLKALLEGKQVLVVAPSYGLCDRILEYLIAWTGRVFKGEIKINSRPPQKVITVWGAQLDCRSAEQPDQIMGKQYDVVVADECSKIPEKIYQRYIRPATGKEIGKHFYISTPFGRNWFWRAWRKAKEKKGAFQWSSLENPYFEKEKWDLEKKELPELIFRQEYGAEFLEDTMVFQGFPSCLREYSFPEKYNPNHLYRMGVDLGKYESFTAIEVMDMMTNRSVECLVFQGDWGIQKQRITAMSDQYGQCPIWIDATSITVGDVYVQELGDAGYNITGYKIQSNISKRQLIEKLIVLIQNHSIIFPDDKIGTPDSQEANTQCRAYTYEMTPSGNLIYKAPQGEYDDCVMARALACWEIEDAPLPEMKKGQVKVMLLPRQEF